MTMIGRRSFKCRCGAETARPEVVNGVLYCPACAFNEQYGAYQAPGPHRPVARDYLRPAFIVRKVA